MFRNKLTIQQSSLNTAFFNYSISTPNGYTYCYNRNGGNVLKINTLNPNDNSIIGTLPTGSFEYGGGEFDPINGEVFIPAWRSPFFYVIDIFNDAINTLGSNLGTALKYENSIFFDGKIYGAPFSILDGYIYDCATRVFSFFTTFAGASKYISSTLSSNFIYFGSENRNRIGVLNIDNNTFTELPTLLSTSVIGSSFVNVKSLNGLLFLFRGINVPEGQSGVFEYNLNDNTISVINTTARSAQSVFTENNMIYFQPQGIAVIFQLNPLLKICNFCAFAAGILNFKVVLHDKKSVLIGNNVQQRIKL